MNRGSKPSYVCFDCNELTKATVQVYRWMGYDDAPYISPAIVHRTGTGCHRNDSSDEVRSLYLVQQAEREARHGHV